MPSEPNGAALFREQLLEWSKDHLRSFPWRETSNPYRVLLAEVLLKQTNAERVEMMYEDFLEVYPTPEALLQSDKDKLVSLLEPLGLYNQRADAFQQIAEQIQAKGIPRDEQELSSVPYVGPYAANAVLCFAFGERRPVVDVNVIRVYKRLFDIPDWGRRSNDMWEFANLMLPKTNVQRYNHALLDFGAEVCTPSNPDCEACFASAYCDYYQQQDDD